MYVQGLQVQSCYGEDARSLTARGNAGFTSGAVREGFVGKGTVLVKILQSCSVIIIPPHNRPNLRREHELHPENKTRGGHRKR